MIFHNLFLSFQALISFHSLHLSVLLITVLVPCVCHDRLQACLGNIAAPRHRNKVWMAIKQVLIPLLGRVLPSVCKKTRNTCEAQESEAQ